MKHILITGAGGKIGSEIAKKIIQEDVQLILLDKNKKRLETACDILRESNPTAPEPILVHQNLNKLELIDQLGFTLYQNFSKCDGLICAHHILENLGPLSHYDRAAWDKMILVNLTASLRLLQSFDPLFQKAPRANIIFLSTQSLNSEAKPYWGVHHMIQAAIAALVQTYNLEKAHSPIRAHLLDPGKVSSDFLFQAYPGTKENEYHISENFLDQIQEVAC